MGLKDYRPARGANSNNNGGSNNLLGAGAVEVVEVQKNDGVTKIIGKAVFDCLGVQAGEQLTVTFDSENVTRIEDNLKRGMGSGPGSIVILENCRKGAADGEVITKWLTTAASAAKKTDPNSPHNSVVVERAFVTTPMIAFSNPSYKKGEPRFISFGLTSKTAFLKTDSGGKVFDREFLQNKLQEVPQDDLRRLVRVTALVTNPAAAVKVPNLEGALEEIKGMIGTNNVVALVRVKDEEDEIEMGYIYGDNRKSVDENIEDLRSLNLIKSVPNADLATNVESGLWTLEVIPAMSIPFLGDSLKRIVDDVQTTPVEDLRSYNITYGENSLGRAVEAVIVTAPTKGDDPFFFHDPVAIDRRNRVALRYIKTENISVDEPAREDRPAPAGNTADKQGAPDAASDDNAEDFDPSQYVITNADDQNADQPQQTTSSASRQRRN